MIDLVASFKKLGKKMTGGDVAGNDLAAVVNNIAENYTGGGGGGGGATVLECVLQTNMETGTFEFVLPEGYTAQSICEGFIAGEEYIFNATLATPVSTAFMRFSISLCTQTLLILCNFSATIAVSPEDERYLSSFDGIIAQGVGDESVFTVYTFNNYIE